MVFHARKRRVAANTQHDAKTTLTSLPDELLLAVLERTASISQILRLRQTSRVFVPACTSIMRAQLKTLYIHPAPASVHRAIKICQSDLSSEIEEVCFVDKVQWPLVRDLNKDFAHSWLGIEKHKKQRGLNPAFMTMERYQDLFSALASLPRADTLTFKAMCDEPGYNMVWEHTASMWIFDNKGPPQSKEQRAEQKVYGKSRYFPSNPKHASKFADVDAIAAALSHLSLTSLKFSDEVPFADERTLAKTRLGNLTHVEFHIHLGWLASPWQHFCNEVLRRAAPTLQKLRLDFEHNPAVIRRRHVETSLDEAVKNISFPKLQRLELRALQLPSDLPYAPQKIDFLLLLERCKTLELLRVEKVFPMPGYLHIQRGQDYYPSMDEILLGFERDVRALEEQSENKRVWEIKA